MVHACDMALELAEKEAIEKITRREEGTEEARLSPRIPPMKIHSDTTYCEIVAPVIHAIVRSSEEVQG
jgi:hypothetical protein